MVLLDTHIWLRWQNTGDLPAHLIEKIETADDIAISAISCWEVAQLVNRKKIELPISIRHWVELASIDMHILPLDQEIALLAEDLPFHHKDPADRFIIATSILHQLPIISLDSMFPSYQKIQHLLVN